jgi:hypothetical protein
VWRPRLVVGVCLHEPLRDVLWWPLQHELVLHGLEMARKVGELGKSRPVGATPIDVGESQGAAYQRGPSVYGMVGSVWIRDAPP